jgi:hypothetical protein
MGSANSMVALFISVAALAVVVWAMSETERSSSIYGHSLPASYSTLASRG